MWYALTPDRKTKNLYAVDVYLDDFILVLQGGHYERQQMTQHLFANIRNIFWPNATSD